MASGCISLVFSFSTMLWWFLVLGRMRCSLRRGLILLEDKPWKGGEGKDSTPLDGAGKMRDASWAGVDAFLVDANHY